MVRDLEKLRTRSEYRLRTGHLVLIIAATGVAGGILFAVASAVAGKNSSGETAESAKDPFAGLSSTETAARTSAA